MMPDFNRDFMEGQLAPLERWNLYLSALSLGPKPRVFEFGTWKGGGSTYMLACAMEELDGHVTSCEYNHEFHAHAKDLYTTGALSHLSQHVTLLEGDAVELLPPLMAGGADMLFMDGQEDGPACLAQYRALAHYVKPGGLVLMHDWRGHKTADVEPLVIAEMDLVKIVKTLAVFRQRQP